MEIKNNVASLREKAGLSVYELSKRCGFVSGSRVLSNYVTRAEQGHSVKVDTALLIYIELKKAGLCENFEDVFWLE
ncbi:transcriptional regulator [Acinetobacter sp. B10A]|uniref:transcriptional regulator n=1 Tax=Acinetobacter baretiae TaxID=2605383 RepID=UPI001B3C9723|nr:transcriptional regulator [Acinetobacter baretiae]MBF7685944.1 transcriptional regulator [Acinetobacter baretiae]